MCVCVFKYLKAVKEPGHKWTFTGMHVLTLTEQHRRMLHEPNLNKVDWLEEVDWERHTS